VLPQIDFFTKEIRRLLHGGVNGRSPQCCHARSERSGARRVRYINFKPGERVANSHFQFVTEATATWRRGLAKFARSNGFRNMEEIKEAHGPRWCYWLQDAILGYADLTISEEQAEWARRHRLKLFDRIYSIPTRGFTAAVSVFRGTPPIKPLICKSKIRPSSASFWSWADPTGEDSLLVLAKFNLSPEDII